MTRRHELGGGMREEIRLKNDSPSPVEVRVDLECDADFADLFEVRGYHRPVLRREVSRRIGGGCVTFAYQNGGFQRATRVYLSGEGGGARLHPWRPLVRLGSGAWRGTRRDRFCQPPGGRTGGPMDLAGFSL